MKHLTYTALTFIALLIVTTMFSFTPLAEADDSQPKTIAVWCLDTESGIKGIHDLQKHFESGDHKSYVGMMLDREVECVDMLLAGHPFRLYGFIKQRLEPFNAYDGRCMQVVRITTQSDNRTVWAIAKCLQNGLEMQI